MIKTIGKSDINALIEDARASTRRRMNLNLHASTDAAVQRLFIATEPVATEPDTYIRPHRHPEPHKWEMLLVLKGRLDLLVFDEPGIVTDRITLEPDQTQLVELSSGTWHSFVCCESGTVVLEVKEGAYIPTAEKDFAPWAPPENSAGVQSFLEWMRSVQPA